MPHSIKTDERGLYVRLNGQVFRPLFPIDYPPHPNKSNLKEGMVVECEHKVHTPLASIKHVTPTRLIISETWFAHGRYLNSRGKPFPTHLCYKPHGFTWEGGVSR